MTISEHHLKPQIAHAMFFVLLSKEYAERVLCW